MRSMQAAGFCTNSELEAWLCTPREQWRNERQRVFCERRYADREERVHGHQSLPLLSISNRPIV